MFMIAGNRQKVAPIGQPVPRQNGGVRLDTQNMIRAVRNDLCLSPRNDAEVFQHLARIIRYSENHIGAAGECWQQQAVPIPEGRAVAFG